MKPFIHYGLYGVIPWAVLFMVCIASCTNSLSEKRIKRTLLLIPIICLLWPYPKSQSLLGVKTKPTPAQTTKLFLQIPPGKTIAVWGYWPDYYIEWDAKPASRDTATGTLINNWPNQNKLREDYKKDILRSQPDYVVEAVGITNTSFTNKEKHGIKAWPWMYNYIKENYNIVWEDNQKTIYKKKE